jgi:micrococcal nuclease
MYEYKCTIVDHVDGDTIDVDIDLGFDVFLRDVRFRLTGIDSPEKFSGDAVGRVFGIASCNRLKELLPIGTSVIVKSSVNKTGKNIKEKWNRWLGEFFVNDKSINKQMVEEGYAVSFFGQNRADLEMAHLANRQRLLYEGKVKLG